MPSRKGQFGRTMKSMFGKTKAVKAERCVKKLKAEYPGNPSKAFAICTASMKGTTRRMGR